MNSPHVLGGILYINFSSVGLRLREKINTTVYMTCIHACMIVLGLSAMLSIIDEHFEHFPLRFSNTVHVSYKDHYWYICIQVSEALQFEEDEEANEERERTEVNDQV